MEGESLPPPPIPQPTPLLLSPADIPADTDGSLPWWTPSWGDIARRVGLRWLYIVPVLGVALGALWLCVMSSWALNLWIYGWKIWLLLIGAAVAAVVEGIRKATKARGEP